MQDISLELVSKATEGSREALEALAAGVEGQVYNLSLRMLGSVHDAQDASQEILIRIITQLSSFRGQSAFSTWTYRIATNFLINYKKSMFANMPLSFEYYGKDIDAGFVPNTPELLQNADEGLLADELKQSCTNVMLQCLDPESRCIYVLGLMFRIDSGTGAEIFGITPEAYRQKLSRAKKKMADFLGEYCGLSKTGKCDCKKRVGYAITTHRLNPENLEYSRLERSESSEFINAMEDMDERSAVFASLPEYRAPARKRAFIDELLSSESMKRIKAEAQHGTHTGYQGA